MFIFYYAVLSEVSPPTALSPFAAAAITGGDPYKTTMQTLEIHAARIPGAVRIRARSARHWPVSRSRRMARSTTIVWITGVTGAGLGALSVAAHKLGDRRTTPVERGLFLIAGAAGVPKSARGDDGKHHRPRYSASRAIRSRARCGLIGMAMVTVGSLRQLGFHKRRQEYVGRIHDETRIDTGFRHASGRDTRIGRRRCPAAGDCDRHRRYRRRLLSDRRCAREPDLEDFSEHAGDR